MALTKSELQLLDITRKVAWGLGKEGRRLTDLIGELSACRYQDSSWQSWRYYIIDLLGRDERHERTRSE